MRRSNVRLGLAAIGAVLFLVGVRREDAALRWVGIGWLVAAFLGRFLNRSTSGAPVDPDPTAGPSSALERPPADG